MERSLTDLLNAGQEILNRKSNREKLKLIQHPVMKELAQKLHKENRSNEIISPKIALGMYLANANFG